MSKRFKAPNSSIDFTIDKSRATGVLKVRGALTEQQVENMQETLQATQKRISHFKINLESITAVDLSSIQALFTTCELLGRSNRTLALDGLCPVTFTSAVENMGLSNHRWLCFGQW
ncbi:MAG: STAS domain-containing protein [bacterium]